MTSNKILILRFCFLRNKRHKIVDLLLNVGARFEHDDIEVARELCVAATENDIDRLRLWKKSQVNMNSTDLDGRTPLHVVSVVYVILYYLELPTSGHTTGCLEQVLLGPFLNILTQMYI